MPPPARLSRSAWRFAILLGFAVVAVSCERQPQAPAGLSDFEAVLRAADDAVLHHDTKHVRRATDFAGVPPQIAGLLQQGDGSLDLSREYRFAERKVLSAEEHRAFEAKFDERLPAWIRDRPPREKWNITPDRWIVYVYNPVAPSEHRSPLRVTLGVFQRSGLWFFAVDYYPFETAEPSDAPAPAAPTGKSAAEQTPHTHP